MEHIYTIKVKRQFDPRGLYPSERRYSASTVFGLAWLHLALAATAFLLASLALVNPSPSAVLSEKMNSQFETPFLLKQTKIQRLDQIEDISEEMIRNFDKHIESEDFLASADDINNSSLSDNVANVRNGSVPDGTSDGARYPVMLIMAPALLCLGALAAGSAAIMASRRWYIDQNIMWFFLSSVFATILAVISLCLMVSWIISASENGLSFCDYFSDGNLFGKVKVVNGNEDGSHEDNIGQGRNRTWFYVIKVPVEELQLKKIPLLGEESKQSKTRKVLSINILIAAIVEILWSLLSLKIAWKGMRSDYPEDDTLENRRGPTVHVVTEIKGNNTKRLPKNTKILPPQPDLLEHYPKNNKIKKFFQSQQENGGFFLRTNQHDNGLLVLDANRESSAEYKERMFNFLNRCAATDMEVESQAPGSICPSEAGNTASMTSPTSDFHADRSFESVAVEKPEKVAPDRISTASWGDIHEFPIYDQNTLNLDAIRLKFENRKLEAVPVVDDRVDAVGESEKSDEVKTNDD